MKIKVGDMLGHEFDEPGKIIAITKDWIIVGGSDEEYALSREHDQYWVPIDEMEIGGGQDQEVECKS